MITAQATSLAGLRAWMRPELAARLAAHRQRPDRDAGQLAAHQQDRLRALLARAIERSPFHACRLGRIDPARPGRPRPPAGHDQGRDDGQLRRGGYRPLAQPVEEHPRSLRLEPSLLLGDYARLVSGGSSGQRGVFAQTIGEYADHIASIIRQAIARLAAAGAPAGMAAALVAAAPPVHSTGFVVAAGRGEPVHLAPVPAALPLAEAVERFNALQPSALIGFPSLGWRSSPPNSVPGARHRAAGGDCSQRDAHRR